MRAIGIILSLGLLTGCMLTENGIIIDTPEIPSVNICPNVATDADVANMKAQIEAQAFKDERLSRARLVTKDHCFISKQVVDIMDSFNFESSKLAIAKDLYDQTTDKDNYTLVIDALVHKGDREELKEFIQTQ